MTEHDRKLNTVRKLLNKAEHAATAHEAEAFTAKATELMLRYAIDEAMLGAKQESTDTLGSLRIEVSGYAKAKGTLLAVLGETFGCKVVQIRTVGERGRAVYIVYGWETDLASVQTLFASLSIQSEREREREWAAVRHTGVHGRSFTTSFLVGFAHEVHRRLQAQRTRTVEEAESSSCPGVALALFDRSQAVSAHVRQQHGKLRKGTGSSVSSRAGYYGGKEAGARADLGQGGLGGRRAALAGRG